MKRHFYRRPNYVIRLMASSGLYPKDSFIHKDALFKSSTGFPYTVVRLNKYDKQKYDGETGWIFPSEIRLLAALSLSYPPDIGRVCFYPNYLEVEIDKQIRERDFRNEKFQNNLDRIINLKFTGLEHDSLSGFQNFDFQNNSPNKDDREILFEKIDVSDSLLIRGISYLLKAQMLSRNFIFTEEAALLAFISLNAALDLVRERLVDQGIKNPTYKDAFKYVESLKEFGNNYSDILEMCWEQRVMLVHPNSKFGILSLGGIFADDFYETYGELTTLYRHLLLDVTD